MKTHDHDNAHAAQRRPASQQAEHGEAATLLVQDGPATLDHRVNHSPRMVAQRQLMGAAFGPVAQREPQGLEEELPVQGKALALQQPVQREAGLDDEEPAVQAKQVGSGSVGPFQAQTEVPAQANLTGMPNQLKSGVEALSGMDMSDVRVHRNSDKPAQLNALAYAQGNEIHLGPGQEQHLPHEAWHVVQQRQGRVQATMQMAGVGVGVNDDVGLEEEADVMGEAAQSARKGNSQDLLPHPLHSGHRQPMQRSRLESAVGSAPGRPDRRNIQPESKIPPQPVQTASESSPDRANLPSVPIQRKVGLEFQTYAKLFNRKEEMPPYGHKVFDLPGLFHVESDDGDVEFVTEPFDEDKNGLAGLMIAVGGMVTMARLMEKTRTDTDEADEPQAPQLIDVAIAFGAGQYESTYPDAESELYIGDPKSQDEGPNMNAAPQATVGVRLDEIPTLLEMLAGNDKVAHRLHGMESFLKPNTPSQAQTQLASDLHAIAGNESLGNENGALRGFITLILVYLRNAVASKHAHKEYVKIAHPVMARNSFTAMFDLLDEDDQLKFLNSYQPPVLLTMSGIERNLSDKLYPNDYMGEDETVHTSPTVLEWLTSIARDDKLAKLPGNIRGRGMGGAKHMDEVAQQPRTALDHATAPVFELRRMLQNVEPKDWPSLARLVHGLMNILNRQEEAQLSANDKAEINTKVNGYKQIANARQTDLNSEENELKYHP